MRSVVCRNVVEELTAVLLFIGEELCVECEEAFVVFFPLVDGKEVVEVSHVERVEVVSVLMVVVWLDNIEEVLAEDNCEDDGRGGEEYCTDEGVEDDSDDCESDGNADVNADVNVEGGVGVVGVCGVMVTVLELKTANGATLISKESSITRNKRSRLALVVECGIEFIEWQRTSCISSRSLSRVGEKCCPEQQRV